MAKKQINAVLCLWEFDEATNNWKLADCFGVDEYDFVCTPSKLASDSRYPYDEFMDLRDKDDEDVVAIDGRMVTCWSMQYGVRVVRFNPPSYPKWISRLFWHDIEQKDVLNFVEGGYDVRVESAEAARKLKESHERS